MRSCIHFHQRFEFSAALASENKFKLYSSIVLVNIACDYKTTSRCYKHL
jgi:hypothetical protein